MDMQLWIGLAALLLTTAINVVIVTKYVTSIELTLVNKFNESRSTLKAEFYKENEKLRREVSETIVPLKTLVTNYEEKHYKLELYIRDNYIEIPTFKQALDDIKLTLKEVTTRLQSMSEDSVKWRRGRTPSND